MKTCICGKSYNEKQSGYYAFDLQKGYEEIHFCSKECRGQWIVNKKIGMGIALFLGIVIFIVVFREGGFVPALALFFLPYTIRQLWHGLSGAGEIVSIVLVLLSTITVIYPAYKCVQEFLEYRRFS